MPPVAHLRAAAGRLTERLGKDPRLTVRVVLGFLLLANLVAAAVVFRPWGGSPEELQGRLAGLRVDVQQHKQTIERLEKLVQTVEKTHAEADRFLSTYFMDRRTAYSTVLSELNELAKEAGIKPKEHSFTTEPIEGSDTLAIMVITGHYEGTYADLIQFVNQLDRSPRFITIESLQAAPQQSQGILNVILKLNVFVRGEGDAQ
jgi:Tfp pilus assembly protein PilO